MSREIICLNEQLDLLSHNDRQGLNTVFRQFSVFITASLDNLKGESKQDFNEVMERLLRYLHHHCGSSQDEQEGDDMGEGSLPSPLTNIHHANSPTARSDPSRLLFVSFVFCGVSSCISLPSRRTSSKSYLRCPERIPSLVDIGPPSRGHRDGDNGGRIKKDRGNCDR